MKIHYKRLGINTKVLEDNMSVEYKEIKEVVTKEVVSKMVCNKCLKETDTEFGSISEFRYKFGYGSKRDCELHEFHLCDDCYDEIIKTFKIKPDIEMDII
jgi:hypothetical protein